MKYLFILFTIGLFSLGVCSGLAQTTLITQEGVVLTRSLSGHVNVGLEKVPAKGVTVELRSSDWRTVLASTRTDDNGYFSLKKPPGKLLNIRLSAPGLNPFQLQVRISKHATRDLTIHLSVAT
jgi:hypothetical protein